ncbi:MAG TPA: hypothetical protein DCX07_04515 [Phycisphaerales bacterium]|nr:hypothetical protein [Phycisphaerales bacterium]
MAERRVAITGLGVVTPAGVGAEAFWQALKERQSAVREVSRFDASQFPCRVAAQLDDFSARNYVPKSYRKAVKVMARDIEIAVAAADLAFRDAGIITRGIDEANPQIDSHRLGCNIGAGLICSDLDELGLAAASAVRDGKFDLHAWGESGMSNLTPLWLLKYLPNMLSCHVTIIHGAEGPSNCITCGDASGHLSVSESARMILRGAADVIVAGGAESKLNPMGLLRQQLLGRLSPRDGEAACRPFDRDHDGTVIGEGGGLLILEDLDRAVSRGAKIYAELVGFGAACDPAGIDVRKLGAGSLDLAVRKAMDGAGITPEQVDLIVAHGTGVPDEDAAEADCWQQAIGQAVSRPAAVAVTGATGSMFAGAGGVELATAALALSKQETPPTVHFAAAAKGVGLNLSAEARPAPLTYAVTGAFTVGGQSAACVLKRYEG